MSETLLEVDDLCVAIGPRPIIEQVTLRIDAGEMLGIAGASGSGKSMTALAIMRLLPPQASLRGMVRLRSAELSGRSESQMRQIRGRDIGMVFQEPMTALNPMMRIGDQVSETVRLHTACSRREARDVARKALDLSGLPGEQGALHRLPYELSGGQRQRAAIAAAIALAPALLIADEPTTALDAIAQAQVLALLRMLSRERGMSLMLITHDLAVIAQLTDRVAIMHEGRIVEQGATQQVLRQPRQPYTQALLAAARLPRKRNPRPHAPREPLATVLQVSGIVKEYPRRRRHGFRAPPALRAVDGVSLSVHSGETVGLVGASGSGKSSLLRVILALQRAQRGAVSLLDEPFAAARGATLKRLRRGIQAVFQDPYGSFDPRWTVERLVAEPLHLWDSPPDTAQQSRRVAQALEQVGLAASDARRRPHEFSGGQRQRIAIARALITQPALIVFDEAVSALDVLVRQQILELLAQLAQRAQLAYLFVTHDLHVVRAIADRIYVMQHGRIVEEGCTDDVFNAPQHAYTQALLQAQPVWQP